MYNENENRVDWTKIIKRVGIMVVGILLILGIITMINKCSKNDEKPSNKTNNEEVSLTKQLDEFESALLKYLTSENLPSEVNATKTIRLKILTNKGLATNLTDKKSSCDTNESYAEVTRLKENYAIKLSLTCGKNKEYRIFYAGCFENCKDGICKGEENSTGGVCTIKNVTPSDDKNNTNNTTNNSNNTSNNTSKPNNTTNNTKPSTNNKPNNNTTNNNTNSSNNNSNTTNTSTPKKTLYEHKKCDVTSYTCESGTLDGYRCTKVNEYTIYGNVIKSNTNPVKYSCEDDDYRFNPNTKTCTKVGYKTTYTQATPVTTCETMWTYSPYVEGWTRTGNTK